MKEPNEVIVDATVMLGRMTVEVKLLRAQLAESQDRVRVMMEALENSQDVLDQAPGTWSLESLGYAYRMNQKALSLAPSAPKPSEREKKL